MKRVLMVMLAMLGAVGCADDETQAAAAATPREITAEEARTTAQAVVPDGKITGVTRELEGTDVHQVVAMTMPGGGAIEVVLMAETGAIDEVKGSKGPFDYEIKPRAGVVAYTKAKATVLGEKKGTIEQWAFENGKNFWEFYVRDADTKLWEIKVSAIEGAVLSTEEKQKAD